MHKGPYRKRNLPLENHQCRKHPLYSTWAGMFARCEDPNTASYRNYGARGIKVSKRWYCFDTFLTDMGPRPKGTSLDRIDNDKNYTPSNCRWATRSEQMLNRRKFSNNTSGARGVVKHGRGYVARIDIDKTRHTIGYFEHNEQAIAARAKFDKQYAKDPVKALASLPKDIARYTSSTGVRGVTPHADGGFTARITRNKQRIYLGYFKTFKEACDARTGAIES